MNDEQRLMQQIAEGARAIANDAVASCVGLISMATAIQASHYCRCLEMWAWCPVHDSCPRCQMRCEQDALDALDRDDQD